MELVPEYDATRVRPDEGVVKTSVTVVCTAETPPHLVADLSSSSGSVTLTVPSNYSGRVAMSTSSGSASSDLPITIQGTISKRRLVGTIGAGSGRTALRTSSGSVRLKRQAAPTLHLSTGHAM